MSIDLSKVTALSDQYGAIAQLELGGSVIWAVKNDNKPIVLQVEKITSDTYAAETTYTAEEFILLDIYPKPYGTVSVTYGGFTKTITDTSGLEYANAQQVFFGTFNGVSDSVTTPASGELTIEGDYYAFSVGAYTKSSKAVNGAQCQCVKVIKSFGESTMIPDNAFSRNSNAGSNTTATAIVIPDSVLSIGHFAFYGWSAVKTVTIGRGVTSIGTQAFVTSNVLTEDRQYSLTTVKVLAETPPTVVPYEFTSGTKADLGFGAALEQIVVPKGRGNTYKVAEIWNEYADKIVEAS